MEEGFKDDSDPGCTQELDTFVTMSHPSGCNQNGVAPGTLLAGLPAAAAITGFDMLLPPSTAPQISADLETLLPPNQATGSALQSVHEPASATLAQVPLSNISTAGARAGMQPAAHPLPLSYISNAGLGGISGPAIVPVSMSSLSASQSGR